MKEYILVKDYVKNKPVALVRSEYGVATVIAGDKSAEKVFIDGDAHNINRNYGFTLLGHSSCHPDICSGQLIPDSKLVRFSAFAGGTPLLN